MKLNTDGVLLGAWAGVGVFNQALDIGAGTGVIAIMIAQRFPDCRRIVAVEIDDKACLDAQTNAVSSPFADRIEIINSSIQDFSLESKESFDLIISNPPFFTGGTFSANENKANVRHAIKLPHGDLLLAVSKLITNDGRFALILPYIEGLRFIDLAKRYSLNAARVTQVLSKDGRPVERLLIELSKENKNPVLSQLIIQHEDSDQFHESYINLTKDFYLKF